MEKRPNCESRDIVNDEHEVGVLQCRVVTGGEEVGVELLGAFAAMIPVGCLSLRKSRWVGFENQSLNRLNFSGSLAVATPSGGNC
jgi:hypothetical protein